MSWQRVCICKWLTARFATIYFRRFGRLRVTRRFSGFVLSHVRFRCKGYLLEKSLLCWLVYFPTPFLIKILEGKFIFGFIPVDFFDALDADVWECCFVFRRAKIIEISDIVVPPPMAARVDVITKEQTWMAFRSELWTRALDDRSRKKVDQTAERKLQAFKIPFIMSEDPRTYSVSAAINVG